MTNLSDDLLDGVPAIASHLGLSVRKTRYLISRGGIPVFRLASRTIAARRSEIDKALRAPTERKRLREDAD